MTTLKQRTQLFFLNQKEACCSLLLMQLLTCGDHGFKEGIKMHFPKFINIIMGAIPILLLLLLLVIFPNNKMRLFIYALLVINALAIIYIYLKNNYLSR